MGKDPLGPEENLVERNIVVVCLPRQTEDRTTDWVEGGDVLHTGLGLSTQDIDCTHQRDGKGRPNTLLWTLGTNEKRSGELKTFICSNL